MSIPAAVRKGVGLILIIIFIRAFRGGRVLPREGAGQRKTKYHRIQNFPTLLISTILPHAAVALAWLSSRRYQTRRADLPENAELVVFSIVAVSSGVSSSEGLGRTYVRVPRK